MKQENLALGVQLEREEGTRPDKPGEIHQAAELGGTDTLGREQSPMTSGGCARSLGTLTYIQAVVVA